MDKREKEVYEKYIEDTIDGLKDYVRETKGEDWKVYPPWKDTLEILETFRVDMLAVIEDSPHVNKGESVNKDEDNILLEKLADLEHEQWIGMMKHLKELSFWQVCNGFSESGGLWNIQMNTKYKDLSKEDKEKDRVFARKVLDIINKNQPKDL